MPIDLLFEHGMESRHGEAPVIYFQLDLPSFPSPRASEETSSAPSSRRRVTAPPSPFQLDFRGVDDLVAGLPQGQLTRADGELPELHTISGSPIELPHVHITNCVSVAMYKILYNPRFDRTVDEVIAN
jgi:hypothetical protein